MTFAHLVALKISNLDTRRKAWLAATGFSEAQHRALPRTPQQTYELNQLYQTLPVMRRRAIEADTKFLKLLLNPPIPSWVDLEAQTEIYPASCFTSHFEYKTKRKEWLQSLSLDFRPFSYVNTQTKYNEVAEIAKTAWSGMVEERRAAILSHANAERWYASLHELVVRGGRRIRLFIENRL